MYEYWITTVMNIESVLAVNNKKHEQQNTLLYSSSYDDINISLVTLCIAPCLHIPTPALQVEEGVLISLHVSCWCIVHSTHITFMGIFILSSAWIVSRATTYGIGILSKLAQFPEANFLSKLQMCTKSVHYCLNPLWCAIVRLPTSTCPLALPWTASSASSSSTLDLQQQQICPIFRFTLL